MASDVLLGTNGNDLFFGTADVSGGDFFNGLSGNDAVNYSPNKGGPDRDADGVTFVGPPAEAIEMMGDKMAARRTVAAGFDWLEFHCAHGYLMSSFISPLTNQRKDEYGGTLENRCRYPLEVFRAMRAVKSVRSADSSA